MVNDMKSKPDQSKGLEIEDVKKQINLIAQPINFEELEKSGQLVKDGAWFRVKNIHLLPEHVVAKINPNTIVTDKKGMKVKLTRYKQAEKLQNKLK